MPNAPERLYEARIAQDVTFGKNVTVVMPSNLYGCSIGDNCFIGPFAEIQKGVKIGNNTRIQSHSFLCEMVNIGEGCFISHGVMFVNDTFAKLGRVAFQADREYWKPTNVGNHVLIGTNATVLPVRICDNAIIGAGSVVTKDIDSPGIYAGNPARYLRDLPEHS